MTLLRASNFCRPFEAPRLPVQLVWTLPQQQQQQQEEEVDSSKQQNTSSNGNKSHKNDNNSQTDIVDDPAVAVYTSISVLQQVGLYHGSVAWLERKNPQIQQQQQQQQQHQYYNSSNKQSNRLLVRVWTISDQLLRDIHEDYAIVNDDVIGESSTTPLVLVTPTVANKLGWQLAVTAFEALSNNSNFSTAYDGCPAYLQACKSESNTVINRVILRPWARPIFTTRSTKNQRNNSDNQKEDLTSKSQDKTWAFFPAGSLLQAGKIATTFKDNQLYFYHIVKLEALPGESIPCGTTDSNTVFQLELLLPNTAVCPRLPCIPLTRLLYDKNSSTPTSLPPHPDTAKLIKVFEDFSNNQQLLTSTSYARQVIHVVGTCHDHHINVALRTAAQCVGRVYLSVSGLAAHAFTTESVDTNSSSSNSKNRHIVTTGGIIDQCQGLRVAFEQAKKQAPSVLHITDFDSEWEHANDAHERQSRLWVCIQEEFQEHLYKQDTTDTYNNNDYEDVVPAVLVVLSTKDSLKDGPIRQELEQPTIYASLPDDKYIQYLWRDVSVVDDDELLFCMKNRSVHEILTLKRDYTLADFGDDDVLTPINIPRLCADFDKKRRKQQKVHIPSVQWADVGGLAHVRHEITNVIELPLQYPYLFAPGTGRSGLLLYGPPGTGKTLVAKAVATECALPFISIKGPELLGSYVGESESRVRQIFARAKSLALQHTPSACVLFFDELDSLAPKRGDAASGGGQVMDRVTSTLLSEMDNATSNKSTTINGQTRTVTVFCMGATNRPDLLDSSLLRPGRLDRLVYLGVSQTEDRTRVVAAQIRKLKLEGDVFEIATQVSKHLPPLVTGADISTVASNALMKATERLCQEADLETLSRTEDNSKTVSVDEVLDDWDDDRLVAIVTLEELIEAAQSVVPSISLEDLEKYAKLQEKFQVGFSSNSN